MNRSLFEDGEDEQELKHKNSMKKKESEEKRAKEAQKDEKKIVKT